MFLEKLINWFKRIYRLFFTKKTTQYSIDKNVFNSNTAHLVNYSEKLIVHLKADHQDLLNRYVEIGTLVEQNDYAQAVEKINAFREAFNRHLTQENVKFYAYCEQNFPESSHEYTTIKNYRKEMNLIAYTVIKFLKNWSTIQSLNEYSVEEFLNQYHEIAEALAERISDEEKDLYGLYRDFTQQHSKIISTSA